MISVTDMTRGQLIIHYGALCQHHQADGARALGFASRVATDTLRASLLDYERAAKQKSWCDAEDALLRVAVALS